MKNIKIQVILVGLFFLGLSLLLGMQGYLHTMIISLVAGSFLVYMGFILKG